MYERILLATDGEAGVDNASEHALELAVELDATVHLLYVVDERIYGAYSGDEFVDDHEGPQSTLEEQGRDALAAIESAGTDVRMVSELRYGRPAEEIVAEADDIDADVIFLGSKTRTDEYQQFVGSVADSVLHLTDRPITVVKTPVSHEGEKP